MHGMLARPRAKYSIPGHILYEAIRLVIPQLRVQVMQMYPYTPLWKRGARGDFPIIILKSPFIPLCQRGIKIPKPEG